MPTNPNNFAASGNIYSSSELTQEKAVTQMRQPTFGEKLVGLSFNPSNDDDVAKAKRLCADLMDLINSAEGNNEITPLYSTLKQHTIGEILNAQMNVVKLLTLKY